MLDVCPPSKESRRACAGGVYLIIIHSHNLFIFFSVPSFIAILFSEIVFFNYKQRNIFFNEHIIKLSAITLFAVADNFLCLVSIIANPLSKFLSMNDFLIL